MENKPYHHGDLRRLLIETGLEIISREGEEKLSLRKAAAQCHVSNAAPYAHFGNKDEFIGAIQQHVMERFTQTLEETARQYQNSPELLLKLGYAYVLFFYQHPFYYDFLFSRKNIKISLSLETMNKNENPPLEILKKAAVQTFKKTGMSDESIQDTLIAMWALVHGLSAMMTMPNVEFDYDLESKIEAIMKAIALSSAVLKKDPS